MKRYFALTIAILIFGSVIVRAQDDDVKENANAPANYDANLRAGARAVAASFGGLETVTIVSKSGNVYRAKLDDGTDNVYLFRANAVYPYFDVQQFGQIIEGKEDLIAPYVECYAKKHGADAEKLKGDGFRPPYFVDQNAMKTELQNGQATLAQLDARLKTLAARPNTFLAFQSNPALWSDVAANRAEYLPCALGDRRTEDIKDSPWLRAHRDGARKTLGTVENWRAGSKDALGSSSEYAFYAVSPKMRADWLKEKSALDFKDEIDKLLKPLADALNEKLPTYFPDTARYAVRNAAEEGLMQGVLPNPAQNKIFKIGLAQGAWQIDKGTLGIPQARYKNGLIYRRNTSADHPYCYATYVNVIQNYAGGGTYAASRSEIIREELVACPATGK